MKVKVNEENCIGCGACAYDSNNLIEIDGVAKIMLPTKDSEGFYSVSGENESIFSEAASVCPVNAIEIK